ncbi:MAG TPA: hypothetical protein VK879_05165 [Candidatus Sulfomarinibacteraceae bacterium]|nr:hypothetical protein [Candidatus Sulfomarinibacteraceae bacterium]
MYRFALVILLLVLTVACDAAQEGTVTSPNEVTITGAKATVTAAVQETTTSESTPRPPDPVMEMVTYRDERAGLALDYPADWFRYEPEDLNITSGEAYTVTFSPWEPGMEGMIENRESNGEPPADAQRIDLVVRPDAPLSLEQAVAQQEEVLAAADPPATIVDSEAWELSNVLPAQRWRLSAEGQDLHLLLTIIDGWTILLRGQTSGEQFEEVARSLRPLARP